jgi:hypothetical protein
MIVRRQEGLEHQRDRKRDPPTLELGKQRRKLSGQTRQIDAPAGFVLAHAEPTDAVGKHRAASRLEMEPPIFHLTQVGNELRERSTLRIHDAGETRQQLCVGQMFEPPETITVSHEQSIPHGFASPAAPRPRAIVSAHPPEVEIGVNAAHVGTGAHAQPSSCASSIR